MPPAHLRPRAHRSTRPLGVLAIAFGVMLLVVAVLAEAPPDDSIPQLVRPATEATTEPTVLGEQIEATTLPDAPPASAAGFAISSGGPGGDTDGGAGPFTPPGRLSPTSPTVAPPVSVTRPPTRSTTTTTRPTTTTTGSTTSTESTTTVVTTQPNDEEPTV